MSRQTKGRRSQLSMVDFVGNKRVNSSANPADKLASKKPSSSLEESLAELDNGRWDCTSSLLVYTADGVSASDKIAGFDLDGTLIKTKSGAVLPKNCNDWQFWNPKVTTKLQQLPAKGYKIVIFTNQRGIERGKVKVSEFKNKIVNVSKALKVPIQAFVSTGPVNYRKPYVGMWLELQDKYNEDIKIDRSASIYCGDAAGRLKNGAKKADHSCADRSFALNLGIPFRTPEEFFLDQKLEEPYQQPGFDAASYFSDTKERFTPAGTQFPYESNQQELIVIVGAPASGKSHISKSLADQHDYGIVNQDTLGTKKACEKMTEKLLNEGKNVIIDNTNRNAQTREFYIRAAKTRGCRVRTIVMQCEIKMAKHNNTYREIIGIDDKHTKFSSMVLRMFYSAYQEPTKEEGFDDIIHCNFVPEFSDHKFEVIYNYILNE